MKKYILEPQHDNAKSFYNKAYYTEEKRPDDSYFIELYSYNTKVMKLIVNDNNFIYQFNHDIDEELLFSSTTLRHIKELLKQQTNLNDITKKELIKNECKFLER